MVSEELFKKFSFEERLAQGERVDWHVHTTASDGWLTLEQVLDLAKEKGLKEIAVADHDSVKGVRKAIEAGRKLGVKVIPNAELTTYDEIRGKEQEVHVLCLNADYRCSELQRVLRKCRERREKRAKLMVRKLRKLGYRISFQAVKKLAGKGVVARPHVANALLAIEENKEKMRGEFKLKREPSFSDVFSFLIKSGRPAYVKKAALSPKQVIRLIKRCRGIPVLAHPGFFEGVPVTREKVKGIPARKIREYKRFGLEGLEVYYPKHSRKQTRFYACVARKLGLIATGGSDFHGIPEQGIELGKIVG